MKLFMNHRLVNLNINSPAHFKEVLDAIDFERLSQVTPQLYARAVLYCADQSSGLRAYQQHFEGIVSEDAGHIVLPIDQLIARGRDGSQPTRLELGKSRTTLGLIRAPETPKEYEFSIDGLPENSYESLRLFSDEVLPTLARKNAMDYNPNHTSLAWFYLSKDQKKPYDTAMLMVSGKGLEVLTDSVDEVKIFTQKDLDRFTKLGQKR